MDQGVRALGDDRGCAEFLCVTARYGFMERPDIPALLRQAREQGCSLDPDDVTYYVARETIIHRADGKGLAKWEETLFAAMERNAVHVSDFFSLPRAAPPK